jgi:hypothetical protein
MSAIKNISLFIPHVFPTFDQKYVSETFSEIGQVDKVDFVAKQDRNGKIFNAVYVHFKKWYNNENNRNFQYNIMENGSDKWYHDDSDYYWIVLPNTAKKHIPGERKPRLDLGEANYISVNKTPEKLVLKRSEHFVPDTPKKPTYAQIISENANPEFQPVKLEAEFDKILESFVEEAEMAEIEAELEAELVEMAEIETEIEAEDENLISIDGRYVQTIEQENAWLHGEVAQLRAALIHLDQMYQAEAAKVRAFSSVETSVDL